jgi:hypothetical protein
MQRLAIALVFALAAVAAVALAARSMRSAWTTVDGVVQGERSGGGVMRNLAYVLLIGLILYVSVIGSA